MHPLSVVIITYNEERNIARCLDSVQELAGEIVVVDSFSTDTTEAICRSYPKVKFIQHRFEGHIQQKNYALDQASNHWVLSLDADEALSDTLQRSIQQALKAPQANGFSFNRLSNYCGKWIHHGSWYPDTKLRLFDRRKVRWTGVNPHDRADFLATEKAIHLKGDLYHYSYYTLEEHIKKLDYFSTLAARAYAEKGRKAGWFNLLVNPGFAFIRDYLFRRGFLDGYEGWLIARLTAMYTFQKYIKLKAINQQKHPSA